MNEKTGEKCAFVPYQEGIIGVQGNEKSITKTCFLQYDEFLRDEKFRNKAVRIGFANKDGKLHSRRKLLNLDGNDKKFPSEVRKAVQELSEYFSKERTDFTVHTDIHSGTVFQQKIWRAIAEIPYAQTVSYGDIAVRIADGDPMAARKLSRAVGGACGANPIPVIIPCHRVIGKNKKLVGFGGGIDQKVFLLEHEMLRNFTKKDYY